MTAESLPLDFYLIGQIDFHQALALQRQLAYEVGDLHRPRLAVLFCEHRDLITIGRDGSRSHVRRTTEQLQRLGVGMHWVSRGGGCVLHLAGQLAVYPIVPLDSVHWTVAEYLRRLQSGIRAAVEQFNVHTIVQSDRFGIWGNTGMLAAMGVSIRNWTTSHGAFLNVNPAMNLMRYIDTGLDPEKAHDRSPMSSLLAERRVAIKMSHVRTALIEAFVTAFGCHRYHIHAAHPSRINTQGVAGESWVHV